MTNPRLELALTQLHGGVWRDFEKFAAEYLAVEYPSLRSTASPNGDRGRDGEVFSVEGHTGVCAQYSVSKDWSKKISDTLTDLKNNVIKCKHLIYATNQEIGANGDTVKKHARDTFGVMLDIRDRSYFLERELTYSQRTTAADYLIQQYADPLLEPNRRERRPGLVLSEDSGRVALLQLALDQRDVETDRSLTRSCFEALVIAALNGTSSNNQRSIGEIQEEVRRRVPAGADGQVDALVEGTLKRLAKKGPIKHERAGSGYHLSHETNQAVADRTAQFLLEESEVRSELQAIVEDTVGGEQAGQVSTDDIRTAVEAVLFDRGESFVAAVNGGVPFQVSPDQIARTLQRRNLTPSLTLDEMTSVVLASLRSPIRGVRRHFGRLGDAYTLFAFLRQTPDVQKVVIDIFSEGDIWLDTSAVLPLIGETLIDDPAEREYTALLQAALDAGLRLHVTEGVIEEVERHLNRSYAYSAPSRGEWEGRPPFLASAFVLSGRPLAEFNSWRSNICGREHPEDDVSEYLLDEHGIHTRSLLDEAESAPIELRAAMQELWNEAHDRRRTEISTRQRLVAHDVENAVGVIQFRKSRGPSPMGYSAWWLTMDKTAMRMPKYLQDRLGEDAPSSPVLSPDFLSQLLRLGPLRQSLESDAILDLPTSTDMTLYEFATPDLLQEARTVREETHTLNARLLRRQVRDQMDRRRRQLGPLAVGGARAIESQVLSTIEAGSIVAIDGASSPYA